MFHLFVVESIQRLSKHLDETTFLAVGSFVVRLAFLGDSSKLLLDSGLDLLLDGLGDESGKLLLGGEVDSLALERLQVLLE